MKQRSMKWVRVAGLLTLSLLLLLPSTPVQAQVAWDAPLLVPPAPRTGWGIYLVDPSRGSGIGVLGTWRASSNLGFRGGLADGRRDTLAAYGGVDISGSLIRGSSEVPFDMDWVAGAGASVGDAALLSFPLGLTLGGSLDADGIRFEPYATPRVVLDAWLGSDRPRDGLRLGAAVDLGVDVVLDPRWSFRFAGTLGDRRALAIGVSIH